MFVLRKFSSTLVGTVRRFPILSFVILACLFGWIPYFLGLFGAWSQPENFPFGPLPAALIVVACQGRTELRAWGRQLRNWRVAPKWYLLAVLAPAVLHTVNVLINHGLGAPLPTADQLANWPTVPATMVITLVLVGLGEEAGWIAFAAPILLRRHGLVVAWVLASAMRIFWHLPMMISGDLSWVVGIVGNAAFTMVMLQVFVASGGRWTLVAVWHATLNAFGGSFFFQMVTGEDRTHLDYLLAAMYTLVAVVAYFAGRAAPGDVQASPEVSERAMVDSATARRS
jgi:membrane protease YdiL (CAAX protease family)